MPSGRCITQLMHLPEGIATQRQRFIPFLPPVNERIKGVNHVEPCVRAHPTQDSLLEEVRQKGASGCSTSFVRRQETSRLSATEIREMDIERRLLDIERKLWTNDPVFYENNLIEEAVLVFSGVSHLSNR
jgi:hypothetical protein